MQGLCQSTWSHRAFDETCSHCCVATNCHPCSEVKRSSKSRVAFGRSPPANSSQVGGREPCVHQILTNRHMDAFRSSQLRQFNHPSCGSSEVIHTPRNTFFAKAILLFNSATDPTTKLNRKSIYVRTATTLTDKHQLGTYHFLNFFDAILPP